MVPHSCPIFETVSRELPIGESVTGFFVDVAGSASGAGRISARAHALFTRNSAW
jgi:hypothetical protein